MAFYEAIMKKILVPALLISIAMQPLAAGLALADGRGGGGEGAGGGNGGPGGGGKTGGADRGPGVGADRTPSPNGFDPAPKSPPSDQDDALVAVQRREAVPLEQIMGGLRQRSAGQVVDAALIRRDGVLYYRLTVLDPSGQVNALFFLARTGQPVERP